MKKTLLFLLVITVTFALAGCNSGNGIPEGMQIVRADDSFGYHMYAPEEWTVSNTQNISHAYASRVDLSSVSYTEIPFPEFPEDDTQRDEIPGGEFGYFSYIVKKYFNASLHEFPTAPKIQTECQKTEFGAAGNGPADHAVTYVYDYDYYDDIKDESTKHSFRVMQIFTSFEGRFGIFTFTSYNEHISSKETTQYDYYLTKVKAIIDNFTYVSIKSSGYDVSYPKDSDGFIQIANKDIAKFSLYVPGSYRVNCSDGLVSASAADGSTLTLSVARETGLSVSDYFKKRIDDLSQIVTDYKLIKEEKVAKLGNAKQAAAYEYTYVYNGTTYHVYQIFGITSFEGFVFTYTAKEDYFNLHTEEIKEIAEKVEF